MRAAEVDDAMKASKKSNKCIALTDLGQSTMQIPVTIGPRFLELFSSNLYTSANKAFEELISNAWDAGARDTYVGIAEDLNAEDALLWVLDNGRSMDADGLRQLWAIGDSTKRDEGLVAGREPIGKFGVGKLATYLLANRLTYVCKAADGIVRLVEIDYSMIADENNAEDKKTLLRPADGKSLNLDMRQISEAQLAELWSRLEKPGTVIAGLIDEKGIAATDLLAQEKDEFGGATIIPPPTSETWTLVIMLALKKAGRELQSGRLGFMLEAALPLGNSMRISLNGSQLAPRLSTSKPLGGAELGPELAMESFSREINTIETDFDSFPDLDGCGGKKRIARGSLYYDYDVVRESIPYNHIRIGTIPGFITGQWSVFDEQLTGRKSSEYGRNHGFFINVRGRVVNSEDAYFQLKNLNHTAWAHFRATIRADWLDESLTVNRESLQADVLSVEVFRAFLRALFNQARQIFATPPKLVRLKDAGARLAGSWGAIPLQSFRSAVSQLSRTPKNLPREIIVGDETTPPEAVQESIVSWVADAKVDPSSLIESILFKSLGADFPLFAYDLMQRQIVINEDHPIVTDYGAERESRELLQADAISEILGDAHLLLLGFERNDVLEYQSYRDTVRRIVVKMLRRSAATVAKTLIENVSDSKGLEDAVTDALVVIGFNARKIAKSGYTDGLAISPRPSSRVNRDRAYKFTYDAKSSSKDRVSTSDLTAEKLALHRRNENADYTLIIAPGYQSGQIESVCRSSSCTPMKATTLAKLLMLVARAGSVDLERFETVFTLYEPELVDQFVNEMIAEHAINDQLSLSIVMSVITPDDFGNGESISTQVIADRLKQRGILKLTKHPHGIRDLFRGLEVLVPNALRINGDDVWFATSPQLFMNAVKRHLEEIPESYRLGLDKILE